MSDSQPTPDDAMARQSGAVSEDIQPVATEEDTDKTAQSLPQGTPGSGRSTEADTVEIE